MAKNIEIAKKGYWVSIPKWTAHPKMDSSSQNGQLIPKWMALPKMDGSSQNGWLFQKWMALPKMDGSSQNGLLSFTVSQLKKEGNDL